MPAAGRLARSVWLPLQGQVFQMSEIVPLNVARGAVLASTPWKSTRVRHAYCYCHDGDHTANESSHDFLPLSSSPSALATIQKGSRRGSKIFRHVVVL